MGNDNCHPQADRLREKADALNLIKIGAIGLILLITFIFLVGFFIEPSLPSFGILVVAFIVNGFFAFVINAILGAKIESYRTQAASLDVLYDIRCSMIKDDNNEE